MTPLATAFSPRPVSSSMMQLAVAAEFSVSPGKDLLLTLQMRMFSSFLSSVILTEKSAVLCFLVCLLAV